MAPASITYLIAVKDEKYNLRNGDFVIPRFDTIKYIKHYFSYLGPYILFKLSNEDKDKIL